MTGAEVLLRQRRREGRVEGREEGRRQLLLDLLEAKFGLLSEVVVSRVEALLPEELDRIGRDILTAGTLEDLAL